MGARLQRLYEAVPLNISAVGCRRPGGQDKQTVQQQGSKFSMVRVNQADNLVWG